MSYSKARYVMENKYLQVAKMFTGSIFPGREWMNAPFLIEDKVIATDAHCLIVLDSSLLPEVERNKNIRDESILSVIPPTRTDILKIEVAKLRDVIGNCPIVDLKAECEACDGSGEVEYEFTFKRSSFEIDGDCPICKGNGINFSVVAGSQPDPSKRIKIGCSLFSVGYIAKLVSAAEILGQTEIILVNQTTKLASSVFRTGEAEILIMPMRDDSDEEYEIIHTITI